MKKIIALLITILYTSANYSLAFSELYYLKGIKTTDIVPIVETSYTNADFNMVKKDPYYGVSKYNTDSAVIILQQSGNNMFYYYQSDNNTKINKSVLKEVKKLGIVCEQSFNKSIIGIYDNLVPSIATKTDSFSDRYSFEESTSFFTPPTQNEQRNQSVSLKGYVAQLAAGTKFQAYLQDAINTATAIKGDQIIAVLSQDLVYNGITVAPQGSIIYGTLSKARSATYGSRNGRVVINFNQIITPDNKVYNIAAEEIDFTVSNEGKVAETVKNAAASAIAGALVGILFAAISDANIGRGAAIGAGVGAGSSAIYSTAERGVDAEIPSFTELEITLSKPLSISVNY